MSVSGKRRHDGITKRIGINAAAALNVDILSVVDVYNRESVPHGLPQRNALTVSHDGSLSVIVPLAVIPAVAVPHANFAGRAAIAPEYAAAIARIFVGVGLLEVKAQLVILKRGPPIPTVRDIPAACGIYAVVCPRVREPVR